MVAYDLLLLAVLTQVANKLYRQFVNILQIYDYYQ